ncbi:MAG: hypothetical protein KA151_03170 [Piscinibacter sp.]|nr:hypothetical protein [Piscinibacter sp.]
MSARRAAVALMNHDADIAEKIAEYFADRRPYFAKSETGEAIVASAAGTWTLTLAADAAGVTERQVLAAIAQQLHLGTSCVCRGIAERIFYRESAREAA